MLTGIEEIAQERAEQVEKHGYSLDHDKMYVDGQLAFAASAIIEYNVDLWPWSPTLFPHMMVMDRIKQLRIAGAFIAAEMDRLKSLESEVKNG